MDTETDEVVACNHDVQFLWWLVITDVFPCSTNPSVGVRRALWNDRIVDVDETRGCIECQLWDAGDSLITQQFAYPQYAVPPGNYVIQPTSVLPDFASLKLPLRVLDGRPVVFDYLPPKTADLQSFSFSVVGKLWAASCTCTALQHDSGRGILRASLALSGVHHDWWGCFVLPDSLRADSVKVVDDSGHTRVLQPKYDFVENPVGSYNLVAVRVTERDSQVTLSYARLGVADSDRENLRTTLVLTPNPGSQAATLSFTLDQAGPVQVTAFDATGRRCAGLFSGRMTAGRQTIPLDTRRLADGVYFLRLEAEATSRSARLVVSH